MTSIFEKERLNREETDDRSSAFRLRRPFGGTLVPALGGEAALVSTEGSGASGVVSAVAARFLEYTHVPRAILDPDAASG